MAALYIKDPLGNYLLESNGILAFLSDCFTNFGSRDIIYRLI